MKNLKSLNGLKMLTKSQQTQINGGASSWVYCGGPNQCCRRFPNGFTICDAGYCSADGRRCTWA